MLIAIGRWQRDVWRELLTTGSVDLAPHIVQHVAKYHYARLRSFSAMLHRAEERGYRIDRIPSPEYSIVYQLNASPVDGANVDGPNHHWRCSALKGNP